YLMMSFGVFIMRQYFRSAFPDEMMDAARIDGASEWRIFASVAVPTAASAMAAVAIFGAIQAWTAFIWPLIMASAQEMYTTEVGLAVFQKRYTADYGAITAGAIEEHTSELQSPCNLVCRLLLEKKNDE